MKHFLRILLPAIMVLSLSSSWAHAQTKIATVDMRKLFHDYWKTKQAQSVLDNHKAELAKEARGLRDNLKKADDKYQKLLESANDQAVSSGERARRQQAADDELKQLQNSRSEIEQFERQAQATLADQVQRMRGNLISEIQAAVAQKARADGYTLVIDTSAQTPNETPVVLYHSGDSNNDLTRAVLAQLNAGAPIDLTTSNSGGSSSAPSSSMLTTPSLKPGPTNQDEFKLTPLDKLGPLNSH